MRLDAADLALLEIDSEKLEPLGRGLVQVLLEQIRYLQDDVKDATSDFDLAVAELRNDLERADTEVEEAKEALSEARERAKAMREYILNIRALVAHVDDNVDRIIDP